MKHELTQQEIDQIHDAIAQAEKKTSGEIRVFIDRRCKGDVLDRAAFIFKKLNMHETELKNGVLFYIAFKDHKFAIIGDSGINQLVPSDFWEQIKNRMQVLLRDGKYADAIINGILEAGEQLSKHFPWSENDKNELSDQIEFGS